MNGWKKHIVDHAAVILALMLQSAVLVWWAATLTVRVEYVQRDLKNCSDRVYRLETGVTKTE